MNLKLITLLLVLMAIAIYAQPIQRSGFTTNQVGSAIDAGASSIFNASGLSLSGDTGALLSISTTNATPFLVFGVQDNTPHIWNKELTAMYFIVGPNAEYYPLVFGADGNVGVRDFSPSVAFSVTGDAAVSGTLTAGTFDGAFDGTFSGTHSGTWAGSFSTTGSGTVSNLVISGNFPDILLDSYYSGSNVRIVNENGVLYFYKENQGKTQGVYLSSVGFVLQDKSLSLLSSGSATISLNQDSGHVNANASVYVNQLSFTPPNTTNGSAIWSSNSYTYVTSWIQGISTNTTELSTP